MELPEAIRRVIRLRYLPRRCDTAKLLLPKVTVKYSFVLPEVVLISRRIRPWKYSKPGHNKRIDEFLDLLYVERNGVIEWQTNFFAVHDPREWK